MLALLCLISITAFSQTNTVDVIMDGKLAKMDLTTGVITITNGAYATNQQSKTLSANKGNGNTHMVSKGETLYSISKMYGISMAQIKSLNNLSTNALSLNQQLIIGYDNSAELTKNVYTVQKGDSLYRIAKSANLTIQELKALNNLESNTIAIGQELKLK